MTKTFAVGQGEYVGNDNRVLQRAVDEVARAGGGTVEIPAGIYQMHNSLHLRDNVQIVGEANAILQKVPSVQRTLNQVGGYGHFEFSVSEPERFEIGTRVLLSDDNAFGFYTTAGTIVDRIGDYSYLDRPFAHDYRPNANALVTDFHGDAISFQQSTDVVVKNCDLHHNSGGGIHPGSGSTRYWMQKFPSRTICAILRLRTIESNQPAKRL